MRNLISILFLFCFVVSVYAAKSVTVYQFGAKGDGETLDTKAINYAIDSMSRRGGGVVVFPAGIFLTHSIRLKSNITLLLEEGAVIKAAIATEEFGYDEAEENPYAEYQDFGHSHWKNSLIWGIGLSNITIEGNGRIDGTNLSRGLSKTGSIHDANKAIALRECTNVRLADIEMLRCGHFAVLATGVETMSLSGLKIDTNRDGLDIDGCMDVSITDCRVNSPWDDAIVLKSSYALGRFADCELIQIERCKVSGYDCGTMLDGTRQLVGETAPDRGGRTGRIKIGTESSGSFRDITIRDCTFEHCRGLALETVDGGHMERVLVENIRMDHIVNSAIFLRLASRMRSPENTPMGSMRDITIRNVRAFDVDSRYSSIIAGVPDYRIENVLLDSIEIHYRGGCKLTKKKTTITKAPWEEADWKEPHSPEEVQRAKERMAAWKRTERDTLLVVNPKQVVPEQETSYPEPWIFGVVPAKGMYLRHVKGLILNNVDMFFDQPDERPLFVKEDVL